LSVFSLAFLERVGGAGGEKGEGFLEEEVGGGGLLLARALAVKGPRKRGVAAGPILRGEFSSPLGDERSFPFAAEGDEGEDLWFGRAALLRRPNFRAERQLRHTAPSVIQESEFVLAPDEFGGGVFEDAGNVEPSNFTRLTNLPHIFVQYLSGPGKRFEIVHSLHFFQEIGDVQCFNCRAVGRLGELLWKSRLLRKKEEDDQAIEVITKPVLGSLVRSVLDLVGAVFVRDLNGKRRLASPRSAAG